MKSERHGACLESSFISPDVCHLPAQIKVINGVCDNARVTAATRLGFV